MPGVFRLTLFILLAGLFSRLDAATYYWVGGTGYWSNLNNWVTTSGGNSGFTVIPGAQDTVVFDDYSFLGSSDTIFIAPNNSVGAIFYTSKDSAVFIGTSAQVNLTLYSELNLNHAIRINPNLNLILRVNNTPTHPIHLNHTSIPYLILEGKGNWLIQDTAFIETLEIREGRLRISSDSLRITTIRRQSGVVSAGLNITLEFLCEQVYIKSLGLYADSLLAANTHIKDVTSIGLSPVNSYGIIKRVEMLANASPYVYPSIPNGHIERIISNGSSIAFPYYGGIVIDTLSLTGSSAVTFNSGTHYIKHIEGSGTCARRLSITGPSNGNAIIDSLASYSLDYCSFNYIHFASTIDVPNSVDIGNNSGINFIQPHAPTTYYWIGGRGKFEDGSHWSLNSGGSSANCLPTAMDTAVFDGNSFSSPDSVFIETYCDLGGLYIKSSSLLFFGYTGNPNTQIKIRANLICTVQNDALAVARVSIYLNQNAVFEANGSMIKTLVIETGVYEARVLGQNLVFGSANIKGNIDLSNRTILADELNIGYTSGTVFNLNGAKIDAKRLYILANVTSSQFLVNNLDVYVREGCRFYSDATLWLPKIRMVNITGIKLIAQFEGVNARYVEMAGNWAVVTYGVEMDTLRVLPNSQIEGDTRGKKLKINNRFDAVGTCQRSIVFANSRFSNSPFEIAMLPSTQYNLRYVNFRQVEMTGKSGIVAMNSHIIMSCSGFSTASFPGRSFYWIGGTGSWNKTSNWSYQSGGSPVNCIPNFDDTVVFDANSFLSDDDTVILDQGVISYCGYLDAEFATKRFVIDQGLYSFDNGLMVARAAHFNAKMEVNVPVSFHGRGAQFINFENMVSPKMDVYLYNGGNYFIEKNAGYMRTLILFHGLLQLTGTEQHFGTLKCGYSTANAYPFARAFFHQCEVEVNGFELAGNGVFVSDSASLLFHAYLENNSTNQARQKFKSVRGVMAENLFGGFMAVDMQVQSPFMSLRGNTRFESSIEVDSLLIFSTNAIEIEAKDSFLVKDYFQMAGHGCLRPRMYGKGPGPSYFYSNNGVFKVNYLFIEDIIASGSANFDAGSSSTLIGQTGNWSINQLNNYTFRLATEKYYLCDDSIKVDISEHYGLAESYNWSNGADSSVEWFTQSGAIPLRVNYAQNCYILDTVYVESTGQIIDYLMDDTLVCGGGEVRVVSDSILLADWKPLWNTGDTTYSILVQSSGIYSMQTSFHNCKRNDSMEVYIAKSSPNQLAVHDSSFCMGDSIWISLAETTGVDYHWLDGVDGSARFVKNTGTYYLENADSTCAFFDTLTVATIQLAIQVFGDTFFCTHDSTFISTIPSSGNYQWSNGDTGSGVWFQTSGKQLVTRTDSACTVSDSVELYVLPLPTISFQGDSTFCDWDSTLIEAIGLGNSWLWMDGATTNVHYFNSEGWQQVRAEKDGCFLTDSVELFKISLPVQDWADIQLCSNDTLFVQVPVNDSFVYSMNQTTVQDSFEVYGEEEWIMQVERGKCAQTDTFITFFDNTLPFTIPDTVYFCDLVDQLLHIAVAPGYRLIWEQQEVVNDQIWIEAKSGEKQFQVYDSLNCEITGSAQLVACGCRLYFPNSFTPNLNKDNINSTFGGEGCAGMIGNYDLMIYNRWGALLFESHDMNHTWDGTFEGKACKQDVYVYRVNYLSERENSRIDRINETGTITILR